MSYSWSFALVLACAGALLLSGCGGQDGSEAYSAAARLAAADSVLSLDDLGGGWEQSGSDTKRPRLALEGECAIFNAADASRFDGEVATASSGRLTGPDGEDVSSSVTVFENEDAAEEAVDRATALIDGCSGQVEGAARGMIEDSLPGGAAGGLVSDLEVHFGRHSFTEHAESTSAYRLDAAVSSFLFDYQFTGDVIVIRDGPVVGVLSYFISGEVDAGEEERLALAQAGKLEQAAGMMAAV